MTRHRRVSRIICDKRKSNLAFSARFYRAWGVAVARTGNRDWISQAAAPNRDGVWIRHNS